MKNKNHIIFDNRYYRLKFLTQNPPFLKAVKEIKQNFAHVKCSIPDDGFSGLDEFRRWKTQVTKQRIVLLKDGKELHSPKEAIEALLKKFQLNNDYYFPIWGYVYFGFPPFSRPPFEIVTKSNDKSEEVEIYVKIFTQTRKKDLINNWRLIKNAQKQLPKSHKRNREKEFEKYLKVYQDYLEIKQMPMKQRKGKHATGVIYDIVAEINRLSYVRVKDILKQVKAAQRS